MKRLLLMLVLTVLFAGFYSSCKTNDLDSMRAEEVATLDKYVKDNNLTGNKDASGIYFKLLEDTSDTTQIRSGYKVMIYFNITLLDGTELPPYYFSTEDEYGHNYEEFAFYVDVSNDYVNKNYVQQIAGIHQGLKKMKVGQKALMVIPSELAFKAVDNSEIGVPRFSTLLATVYIKKAYSPEQQR